MKSKRLSIIIILVTFVRLVFIVSANVKHYISNQKLQNDNIQFYFDIKNII
jgi:hypothetical protein